MKRRIKRIVSIILTIALLVISLPVAKAESNNIKDGMIASFMPLEDHIQTQLVPLGTKEIDLNLPETITVNKYQGEAVEQAKNAVEEPIHWQSEPRYDETKAGEYHFTPELDNNMISHGVQLPSITIQVIEETNTLESVSNTSNNAQTVLNRNVSGITNIPISIGGVERDEDYAVITINGNQDKYIQGYYRLVDFNTSEPELNDQDRKFSVNELDLELEIDGLDKEKKYDLWFQLEDTQTMEQYKFKIEIPAYRDKGDVLFVVSGNSNYIDPNIVTITADSAPKYMVFDKWVGGDDSIFSNGSRTDATTTIVMPDKAVILTATYKHNHEFDTVWHSDETNHWHECLAGDQEISDQQPHQYGDWIVDQKPTLEQEGIEYRECSVCKYRDTRAIAKPSGSIPSELGIKYAREERRITLILSNFSKNTLQIHYRLQDFNESEPILNGQDNSVNISQHTEMQLFFPINILHSEKKYDVWFEVVDTQTNEYYKFKIEIPPYSYALKVDYGTGTGSYKENEIIEITATDRTQDYMVFDKWVGGDDSIFSNGSRSDATTTIIMPNQATTLTATYKHKHEFDTVWHSDETSHWHECLAKDQEISDQQTHQYGAWIVDLKPTLNQEGNEYRECNICKYRETRTIAKLIEYVLTIDSGTGTGMYREHDVVTITANSAPKYMVFDKWVGGDDSIFSNGSRTDATTTIVMPNQATTLTATYKHKHEFDTVWHSDETNHWHECLAADQEISDQQTHQYGAWIVDQEPTLNKQGSQYRSCEVCGYEDRQSIDQLVTAYNKRTLTDSISGIQVSGSFSDDAQLEVIGENVLHKEGTCQVCDELRKQQDQLILLYDIHLKTGSYQGAIEVSIPVDEKYNGQSVMLLHCNNQVLESKALVVEHGMVKGTFSSLSPYAIRIIQQKEVEEPVIIKATGQTQTETIICMLTWILVLASLVGYGVLMLRKNHKK